MARRTPRARFRPLDIVIIGLAALTLVADYPGRWRTGYGRLRQFTVFTAGVGSLLLAAWCLAEFRRHRRPVRSHS